QLRAGRYAVRHQRRQARAQQLRSGPGCRLPSGRADVGLGLRLLRQVRLQLRHLHRQSPLRLLLKPQNLGPHARAGALRFGMALLLSALLTGCQSPQLALQALADTLQRRLEILDTSPFPLLLGVPDSAPTSTPLRIYLEGDGRAWATPSQPSLDPSPRNLLVARLAFADPQPSLYLARPCQFVRAPGCQPLLWTDRRFSAEVLDSLDAALTRIKATYGNQTFELIGYSGGGALALLLAARRDDVALVQTLAGNLT